MALETAVRRGGFPSEDANRDQRRRAIGFPGEIFYGVGALLLGLVCGISVEDATSASTASPRFQHPETYDQRREELKRKVEPF